MRREKSKFFTILVPIYDCHVSFAFAESDESVNKQLAKKGIEDFKSELSGIGRCTALKHSGPYLVRTKNYPDTSRTIGVLSHEIFHLATFILDDRAIKFDMAGGDETHAYLIQYLTEKVFEKI